MTSAPSPVSQTTKPQQLRDTWGRFVRSCDDCGVTQAEPKSGLCPGCEAYREHTGHV